MVPDRTMLFINLGAKHSSAALACYTQMKRIREEELRYYGFDEPDFYDEFCTEILKTYHSSEVNLGNYTEQKNLTKLTKFFD